MTLFHADGATFATRTKALLLACLCFVLTYYGAAAWAQQQPDTLDVSAMLLPVQPWLMWPYLSSPLMLCWLLLAPQSLTELRLTFRRLVLITCLAACCFVVLPMTLQQGRPAPTVLFGWVQQLDPSVNLFPSLHVAYAYIGWRQFWCWYPAVWQRVVVSSWLALLMLSTLFTAQHVWPDLLAGLALAWGVQRGIHKDCWPQVTYYSAAAALCVALWQISDCGLLWYFAASFGLVASQHAGKRVDFLQKRQGRHPLWVWCGYAPYLLLYRLTWLMVRARQTPAVQQIAPRLWVGRRLTEADVRSLPHDVEVFDVSGELPEIEPLRHHAYQHWPLPDIVPATPQQLAPIVAAVAQRLQAGANVFVHCAMGLQRSHQVVAGLTPAVLVLTTPPQADALPTGVSQ